MQITRPFTFHIFTRKKSWFDHQVFQRAEEFSIEMGEIIKEMRQQVPEALLRFYILLPAVMTIWANNFGAAIQTCLFGSLGEVGQF